VIKSFGDENTRRLFDGQCPRRFQSIRKITERKLAMLDAATSIGFLRSPPGNRLEQLSGDRMGQWSIRLKRKWRFCFRFESGNAYDVEIVDYHQVKQ
jgi:proteic killer suppression protein